jgi:hypothetical protein
MATRVLIGDDVVWGVGGEPTRSLSACFPRGWPAVFRSNAELKAILKQLKGKRCRAVAASADKHVPGAQPLDPLSSFANATAVGEHMGWGIVKGFKVLERASEPVGTAFFAVKHWWNSSADAWHDWTPPLAADADTLVLLVESDLGDKRPQARRPAFRTRVST